MAKKTTKRESKRQAAELKSLITGLCWRYAFQKDLTAGDLVVVIGDSLSWSIARCSLDDLLSQWTQFHYRPTLRADLDPFAEVLADIYDFTAAARGINVKAYRG